MALETAVRNVRDFDSLLDLLRHELEWQIDPSLTREDVTFDWTPADLRLGESVARRLQVWQLRPLTRSQPWGIFFVEFADERVYRTGLRQVLRGVVPSRRRDSNLPAWKRENLLFICTAADYQQFTFAHFREKENHQVALATFGWERGDTRLRTLCEFNLPKLRFPEDGGKDAEAWLTTWAQAFDKEPITRDFFKRFDKALAAVKADLQTYQGLNSADAYSRAQLLLERLIFLYFLQNRGWLNQQHDYLMSNFTPHRSRSDEFSYYEQFLEKLFYTLASAPLPGAANRLDGIPFLNGGLFDDDEFAPTPIRLKHNPPLRVRNSTFAFVFDELLEAFNFTVREDTPLNQDVAVDPEMLGKVFESIVLHAEAADPDAVAPDKRKATGSYYTPRIVVHFICREALRQYLLSHLPGNHSVIASTAKQSPTAEIASVASLPRNDKEGWSTRLRELLEIDATDGLDTDELNRLRALVKPSEGARLRDLLQNLKCCDPAVGSGAFPVGLLHELVNLRRVVETAANGYVDPVRKEGAEWIHRTKANIVENCLYGVDIQQQAIEICCLRLWLSLVVDYDLGLDPFTADRSQFLNAIKRISQLPNLEMNFRRGDSLLDQISGVPVRIEPGVVSNYRKDFETIQKLGAQLHRATKSEKKKELRVEILRWRLDLSQQVLQWELTQLRNEESKTFTLFEDITSPTEKRKRIAEEMQRVQEALNKVEADRKALEKLAARPKDSAFQPKLRRLEGAEFDSPFNFVWRIDFADIFAPRRAESNDEILRFAQNDTHPVSRDAQRICQSERSEESPGGFDIIVGNPPFVTARNPVKRELYRERWKRVCTKNYQMVCPFFDLSFGLLRPGGQLGFIVSNAFAKREFGKPLVEDFFPTVDLQKVIDCSGLMFPGHGTPTCIVFGRNEKPDPQSPVRVAAILPGGGDLRTPPEESPLWHTLSERHDQPGYRDSRVIVAGNPRNEVSKWPWHFDPGNEPTQHLMESSSQIRLSAFVDESVGHVAITRTDDVFILPEHLARRCQIELRHLRFLGTGETMRNWSPLGYPLTVFPYEDDLKPLNPQKSPHCVAYLKPFRSTLENIVMHGSVRKKETNVQWFEYSRLARPKFRIPYSIVLPEIATHNHALVDEGTAIFHQTVPVIKLPATATDDHHHLLAALLNSSAALFYLKQVCFNKGAGEDEERDRFVYAGGKVEQLPVPEAITKALRSESNPLTERLTELSRACYERGRQLPSLAMKKLFEQAGEAYHDWNAALPGYVAPHAALTPNPSPDNGRGEHRFPFETAADLRTAFQRTIEIRDTLRAEMIALQEEMDWRVYEAYGLIAPLLRHSERSEESQSVRHVQSDNDEILRFAQNDKLGREQRPFCLWAQAEGDFDKAVSLIPPEWSTERKSLWTARLTAIRDNEHIRRIEQPVYKRRWDEQWKVGNRWQCGQPAYDAESLDAFAWWLSEKAEWWLETQKDGGPVTLDVWTIALWNDPRVRAAWQVAAEVSHRLEQWKQEQNGKPNAKPPTLDTSTNTFTRFFKSLVKDQTVPDDIPPAVPWEELEKKMKVPASVKRIRGKLNVPRERFRVTAAGQYRVA